MVAAVSLTTLVLLAGCLDFDEQEVVVAYDGKRDQLDAQVVYRGLFSGGKTDWSWFGKPPETEDVDGTEKNLDQLLAGRPLFGLLGGWPVDLGELREVHDERQATLARALTVDHGKFFRDESGRLCGWQHLQVRDLHAALDLLDALLREELASEGGARGLRRQLGCDDEASSLRVATALEKKARFLEAVDGTLMWHVPASEAAARALAKRIETAPSVESFYAAEATRASSGEGERKSTETEAVRTRESDFTNDPKLGFAALLHAFGVTTKPSPTGLDLVLWEPTRAPLSIAFRPPLEKRHRYDLSPYLAKRKVEARPDVTAETLRRDFDERRAR